jgi:hypothetical protein
LGHFIPVAEELKLNKPSTAKAADLARDFRNLIHPGAGVRKNTLCDKATAHVIRSSRPSKGSQCTTSTVRRLLPVVTLSTTQASLLLQHQGEERAERLRTARPRDAYPRELTQTRSRCSSLCKFRQVFEVTSPGRVRWAMTSSILLIGARGSSGRACGREFATAKVRSECRQGRSVFLVAPGREPFRQPDAAVLLRRLLHRAGNARSL